MLGERYNLIITGTLRKNKCEIPNEMKVPSKIVPDSKFCYSDNVALVCYTPKKNKIVLLVSTFTLSNEITDDKPNMIRHYNKTKGGTYTFDQLCHLFTTARRTKRWQLRDFFGMLDQAAVNARILHTRKLINERNPAKIIAQSCIEEIIQHLVKPMLQENNTFNLHKDILFGIKAMLAVESTCNSESVAEVIMLQQPKRCSLCERNEDRKAKMLCRKCMRTMCHKHRAGICIECASEV